jgi:hypothetical protein
MEADSLNTRLEGLAVKINNLQPASNATSASLLAMANQLAEGTKFIDDEVVEALDSAMVKTRDYGAAVRVTQDAMKLATLANIPLEQATKMLSLAYEGNTRGMAFLARQLGVNIKDGETYASIMAKINEQSAGLGDVMQNSVAVQMKKVGDEFKDVFVEIVRPNIPVIAAGMRMLGVVIEKLAQYIKLMGDYWGALFTNIAADGLLLIQVFKGELSPKNFLAQVADNAKQTGIQLKDDLAALVGFKKELEKPVAMPAVGHGPKSGGGEEFSDAQLKQYTAFWKKQDAARDARIKNDVAQHKKHLQYKNELDEWYYGELDKLDKETWDQVDADANKSSEAINQALGNIISGGIDNLVDSLFKSGQSFEEWAQNAITEIGKVIAKMMLLAALEAIFPAGGFIGDLIRGADHSLSPVSPGSGVLGNGQLVVEVRTADPATTINFINRAYQNHASPGQLAQLNRNVNRGSMVDNNR